MIVEIDGGRLRCVDCGREWTPKVLGHVPQQCGVCLVHRFARAERPRDYLTDLVADRLRRDGWEGSISEVPR